MKYFLVLCAFELLLSGCAGNFFMPASRFESPEVRGEFALDRLTFELNSATEIQLVRNFASTPPDTTSSGVSNSNIFTSHLPGANLGVGVSNSLELSYFLNADAGSMLRAKMQLIGAPENSAASGNVALAISAGFGFDGQGLIGIKKISSDGLDYTQNYMSYDFAIIAGYRFSDEVLVYSGPYLTLYSLTGNISQKLPGPRIDYVLNSGGSNWGLNWGLEYSLDKSKGLILMAEIDLAKSSWQNTPDQSNIYWGLAAAMKF